MTQPKQTFDPVSKRFPSTHIFPELMPPIDQGRSYPVWPEYQSTRSPLLRLALCVMALFSVHTAPKARPPNAQDRNKGKRGSGSW